MQLLPLTKAQHIWPVTDFLKNCGVPVARYIEQAHLPQKMLDAPDLYVDESRFWELTSDLAKREGFLDLGFRAGAEFELSALGDLGTRFLAQPTLKAALETFNSTMRTEALRCRFELMPQGDFYWFTLYQNCPHKAIGREVIELYDLQVMIKLVQSALGRAWLPPAIHLNYSSLPNGLAPSKVSSGSIRFSSTITAIAIPEALMSSPMPKYRSCANPDTDIKPLNTDPIDFPASLRFLLAGYLDDNLTIDQCADMVGLSGRTMQRRLAEHQTSFQELLDQTRFDLAKQLLEDRSISVTGVGYEIGYADPANFTRAFHRWAGVSPRSYRTSL